MATLLQSIYSTTGNIANATSIPAILGNGTPITGVAITGTGGTFSCNSTTLPAGTLITISGTFGGTGSISGYSNPTTYLVSTANAFPATAFTLTTLAGAALTTTIGTPTGLTYTPGTGIPVTSGSLLVAYLGSFTTARTFSASDSVNGSYNADTSGLSSGGIFTFPNSASGTITVTGTISGAASNIGMIVEEWAGILITTPLDQHPGGNSGSSVTSLAVGPTGALAQSSELVLSMIVLNSTAGGSLTVSAPFTASPSSPILSSSLAVGAANYQPSATTALSCTFNWTTSATARGWITSYKLSPSGSQMGQCVYVNP